MEANSQDPRRFSISIDCIQDSEFRVKFNNTSHPDLLMDEPPPAGQDRGPNPDRLLASAVGGCLSASFMFAARKLRMDIQGMHTEVSVHHTRNEKGRLRVGKIEVEMIPNIKDPDPHKLQRCRDLFEEYCVVTQSVRNGIDVAVTVK